MPNLNDLFHDMVDALRYLAQCLRQPLPTAETLAQQQALNRAAMGSLSSYGDMSGQQVPQYAIPGYQDIFQSQNAYYVYLLNQQAPISVSINANAALSPSMFGGDSSSPLPPETIGRYLCERCFDAMTDHIVPARESETGDEMAVCHICLTATQP